MHLFRLKEIHVVERWAWAMNIKSFWYLPSCSSPVIKVGQKPLIESAIFIGNDKTERFSSSSRCEPGNFEQVNAGWEHEYVRKICKFWRFLFAQSLFKVSGTQLLWSIRRKYLTVNYMDNNTFSQINLSF